MTYLDRNRKAGLACTAGPRFSRMQRYRKNDGAGTRITPRSARRPSRGPLGDFVASAFVGRLRRLGRLNAYQQFRQNLARSIILGLEFLIAGDIIRTVTVDQTLTGAAVLALIVLIRVTLSLTLQFEIEGRWPWQRGQEKT